MSQITQVRVKVFLAIASQDAGITIAPSPAMKWTTAIVSALLLGFSALAADHTARLRVPILVYHRFGSGPAGPTTIRTTNFQSHLNFLAENGYRVIRLRELVDFLLGHAPAPPPRSVVITVDDGHRSVYTELFPLVKNRRIPVTLFIYPSAISHASYALTWPELRELTASGLFDAQSHTYWHPNFKIERRRLERQKYQEFAAFQLTQSKLTLERMLGCRVDLLAWPFGIYDDELIQMAAQSGYVAAFSIERRAVQESDSIMALPRFSIEDSMDRRAFEHMLQDAEKP
ncbi:MAG: polysaccharide deacetylase family protein [Bryobacteraceae bacterium]